MGQYQTKEQIMAALDEMGASPADGGTVEMIVLRPAINERLVVDQAALDITDGLIGDNWLMRGSSATEDGSANPEAQITLMNSRVIQAITDDKALWPLAGDQFFVDMDLAIENLPPGQRIALGTAVLEISKTPHTGCKKFTERFGRAAIHMVNAREGRERRYRGVNARIIQSGVVSVGDRVTKLAVTVASTKGL